ncbi:MAG: transglycosylase SLT domain-containing protein [Lachnospiraceae bacterium]
MNYSRNVRRKAMMKRILISWIIIAVVGIALGLLIGYFIGVCNNGANVEAKEVSEVSNRIELDDISYDLYNEAQPQFEPLDVELDDSIQEYIYYMADCYDIDFEFIMAVIQYESGFKEDVISSTNDYGLMQINECNHEWLSETLGVTDYLDPYQNVDAGLYILNDLMNKYDDPNEVLMCYNMGERGASNLWKNGVYSTKYSTNIIEIYQTLLSEEI